jgi:hypothetical protein
MKKIIYCTIVAVITIAAGWNINQNRNEVALSDIALDNIEALANETIPTPGICTKKFWTEPTPTCCDLIKHCDPGGKDCC